MTASYISLLTYSFIDPLVRKAYRVPHLGLDELPPLQADQSSASLTAEAFPVHFLLCFFVLYLTYNRQHIDPAITGSKGRPHIFRGLVTWLRESVSSSVVECFLLKFQFRKRLSSPAAISNCPGSFYAEHLTMQLQTHRVLRHWLNSSPRSA